MPELDGITPADPGAANPSPPEPGPQGDGTGASSQPQESVESLRAKMAELEKERDTFKKRYDDSSAGFRQYQQRVLATVQQYEEALRQAKQPQQPPASAPASPSPQDEISDDDVLTIASGGPEAKAVLARIIDNGVTARTSKYLTDLLEQAKREEAAQIPQRQEQARLQSAVSYCDQQIMAGLAEDNERLGRVDQAYRSLYRQWQSGLLPTIPNAAQQFGTVTANPYLLQMAIAQTESSSKPKKVVDSATEPPPRSGGAPSKAHALSDTTKDWAKRLGMDSAQIKKLEETEAKKREVA